MSQDFDKKRASTRYRFRATMNIVMGILYVILGIAIATMHKFGSVNLNPSLAYGFCALLLLYGAFRLWRGVQDLKMTNEEEG